MGLSVAAVVLKAGTLTTHGIVEYQAGPGCGNVVPNWNSSSPASCPFVIFVIAGTAELNRPPFDLVEAEQELVGGFNTEYSSIRFALFYLAEFMNTITMSAIFVTLFLGGPAGPAYFGPRAGCAGCIWFFLKLMVFLFMLRLAAGHAAPVPLRPAHGPRLEAAHPAGARLAAAAGRHRRSAGTTTGTRWRWSSVSVVGAAGRLRRCCAAAVRRQPRPPTRGGGRLMGYLDGFLVPVAPDGPQAAGHHRSTRRRRRRSALRRHGRHVLNRYEDGMEKCIGCELCAGVCPARCIYVRGADNPPSDPVSPGERYGFVYEINYLRCIHCDLCVEACPTEAITETKLFEFSFTNRAGRHLHQGRAAGRRRRPAPAPALGGLAPGRGRAHLGLDAGHRPVGRRGLRGPGGLVGRARLRRARPRGRPGDRGLDGRPASPWSAKMAACATTTHADRRPSRARPRPAPGSTDGRDRRLRRLRGHRAVRRARRGDLAQPRALAPSAWWPRCSASPCCSSAQTPTSWPRCRSSSTPAPSWCCSCS